MEVVNELCDLLQTHANRDKVVALASYTLKLWGSTSNRKNLLNASARLTSARATLRIFDDAAVLKAALSYGLGTQDGPCWGTLGVASNIFTLSYLQAEKLIFLMDTGILSLNANLDYQIRTAHKTFWTLFTVIGFVRSIRALHITAQNLRDHDRPKCAPARFVQASLVTTKYLLDIIHVVNWLPPGYLWGGVLENKHTAGVATLSGVLGLLIHYRGKRLMQRNS
ncbi:peroxisomal membrane protein 11C-like [Danaus plexippus]|uniref:peroxisomal membrane protein 11C-like n=1 Tax=Danaus plexippus TaxID=13037 RepID=UPI002AB0E3B9|nr:peroxisomal membrane protein 11C-like [Danaus plexippus]